MAKIPTAPLAQPVPIRTGRPSGEGQALAKIGETISAVSQQFAEAKAVTDVSNAQTTTLEALGQQELDFAQRTDYENFLPEMEKTFTDITKQQQNLGIGTQAFTNWANKLKVQQSIAVQKLARKKQIDVGVASYENNLNTRVELLIGATDNQASLIKDDVYKMIDGNIASGYITADRGETDRRIFDDNFNLAQKQRTAMSMGFEAGKEWLIKQKDFPGRKDLVNQFNWEIKNRKSLTEKAEEELLNKTNVELYELLKQGTLTPNTVKSKADILTDKSGIGSMVFWLGAVDDRINDEKIKDNDILEAQSMMKARTGGFKDPNEVITLYGSLNNKSVARVYSAAKQNADTTRKLENDQISFIYRQVQGLFTDTEGAIAPGIGGIPDFKAFLLGKQTAQKMLKFDSFFQKALEEGKQAGKSIINMTSSTHPDRILSTVLESMGEQTLGDSIRAYRTAIEEQDIPIPLVIEPLQLRIPVRKRRESETTEQYLYGQ